MPQQANTKPLDFVIIGGSLAGLFAGTALRRLGHNILILERTPTPWLQDYGAGLVAGAETTAFLEKYDLTHRPFTVESPTRYYLNHAGDVIEAQDWHQRMTSWDLVYAVLRRNFDGQGSAYVGESEGVVDGWEERVRAEGWGQGTYEHGARVTGVSTSTDTSSVTVTVQRAASPSAEQITADFVIAADGPGSTLRTIFAPAASRAYAGYLLWRGTLPEASLSASARSTFVDKFVFYHSDGLQAIGYLIPGPSGSLEPGSRTVNWGVYRNFPAGSAELAELMTDSAGRTHAFTLPRGAIRADVWAKHKEDARRRLPPQFAEIFCGTEAPFVQCITDVVTPRAVYEGRVLFVGDAACGLRPHTASGTSQAARGAMLLAEWAEGKISLEEWEEACLEYAREKMPHGIRIGNMSQFEKHPFAD